MMLLKALETIVEYIELHQSRMRKLMRPKRAPAKKIRILLSRFLSFVFNLMF